MSTKLTEAESKRVQAASLHVLDLSSDLKPQVSDGKIRTFSTELKRLLAKHSSIQVVVLPVPKSKP